MYGRTQDVAPPPTAADDDFPSKTEVTLSEAGLKLYPNPVETELRVVSTKYDINRLAIYNSASGELVFSCLMPIPQGASIIINMSARSSGYYVVRVWLKEVKKPISCSVYKT
ncbi:MAG: T9SS type A sorting domain-containing protein [Prevotellaceae bacterium]|nr:T9SS type A sorting domain-containing protein [Prevotellaceae bacterium]